jgi:hypothetical protein
MNDIRSIFGQAFTYNSEDISDPHSYYWFSSKDGRSFGIRKTGITEKELRLVQINYSMLDQPIRPMTPQQQAWASLLFEGKSSWKTEISEGITQFIYFSFKSNLTDPSSFEEAVLGLFPDTSTLLWPSTDLALVIARPTDESQPPTGETLIELINADFYVSAKICFGSPFFKLDDAQALFHHERAAFDAIRKAYPEKYVFDYSELIPLLLLLNYPKDSLTLAFKTLSTYFEEEPDVRIQMETFLEHNLNVSTTAKALYMHRNSFNYRLDKLKDKTGLDPRDFHDALFISLELTFRKMIAF